MQSEKFVQEHGGRIGQLSIYGQESNPTTWRLASMNMVIRGMDFDFGKEPANTFSRDLHPDLGADVIMANPPFNMKEWKDGVRDDDQRWHTAFHPPATPALPGCSTWPITWRPTVAWAYCWPTAR